MINSQDIKNGTCIRLDGKLYFCIEFLHVKPGKGNTFMRKFKYLTLEETIIKEIKEHEKEFINKCNNK